MKILVLSDSPFFPSPFKKYYLDKRAKLFNNSNMRQLLFNTAVILAVGELRSECSHFSIHDVTQRIRNKVNPGEWAFSDRPQETVEDIVTYRVDHEEVKTIFNDLYANGILTNLTRQHNGSYYEYSDATPSAVKAVACSPTGRAIPVGIAPTPVTRNP